MVMSEARRGGPGGRRRRRHHSHHHGAPTRALSPAPHCHPRVARIPISVHVRDWGGDISCNVVSADVKTREVLIALPDQLGWTPSAERDHKAHIGWADHDKWHEATAHFTMSMRKGSRYFRLRVDSVPLHRERRAHVRAKIVRPVVVYPGGDKVRATTMDVSEAAMRIVMGSHEVVRAGDKVHVQLSFGERATTSLTTLNLDGHVYRTRDLRGSMAGKKEVVVIYEHMPACQRDYIRGLVYDWDLEHRNPGREDR